MQQDYQATIFQAINIAIQPKAVIEEYKILTMKVYQDDQQLVSG